MAEEVHDAGIASKPIEAGDIVELKSGSFPMTVEVIRPWGDGEGQAASLIWDLNGAYSGKPARMMTRRVPVLALKPYIRPDAGDDLPF